MAKCGDIKLLLKLTPQKWPKVNNTMISYIANHIALSLFLLLLCKFILSWLFLQIQQLVQACLLQSAAIEVSVSLLQKPLMVFMCLWLPLLLWTMKALPTQEASNLHISSLILVQTDASEVWKYGIEATTQPVSINILFFIPLVPDCKCECMQEWAELISYQILEDYRLDYIL